MCGGVYVWGGGQVPIYIEIRYRSIAVYYKEIPQSMVNYVFGRRVLMFSYYVHYFEKNFFCRNILRAKRSSHRGTRDHQDS